MKTVETKIEDSFREKGSKFIGFLFPVATAEQFEQEYQQIISRYPDATHHCYAWRIGPNNLEEFSQDDGEPGGTAGLPILNTLRSFEVVNAACVVVRYYGGTKLGKAGLIQAYGQSARLCLEKFSLPTLIPTSNFKIVYPYNRQAQIDQLKNNFDLKEIDARYLEKVSLVIACRAEHAENFRAALKKLEHLEITAEEKGNAFVTMQS